MQMEGTSKAGKDHSEGSGKKSKESRKRKALLDAENENVKDITEVPNLDAAVAALTITGSNEAQSVLPLKKSKKRAKLLKEVQGSVERAQESEQQRSPKRRKRVKFNLESSIMSSDQEKREPVKDYIHKEPMSVQGNETKEDNKVKKPSDTTWVQKASWTSLVGETGRVSFSLGSIVGHNPGNMDVKSTGPAQPSMDVQLSNTVSAWIDGSSSAPLFGRASPANGHSSNSHATNTSKLMKKSEMQSNLETVNPQSVRTPRVQDGLKKDPQKFEGVKHKNARSLDLKQAIQSDHQNGVEEKICRFMRSDNYEQEWLEAKRAVKDIFKRSRKDALRSMKMFHKKKPA